MGMVMNIFYRHLSYIILNICTVTISLTFGNTVKAFGIFHSLFEKQDHEGAKIHCAHKSKLISIQLNQLENEMDKMMGSVHVQVQVQVQVNDLITISDYMESLRVNQKLWENRSEFWYKDSYRPYPYPLLSTSLQKIMFLSQRYLDHSKNIYRFLYSLESLQSRGYEFGFINHLEIKKYLRPQAYMKSVKGSSFHQRLLGLHRQVV